MTRPDQDEAQVRLHDTVETYRERFDAEAFSHLLLPGEEAA